MKRWIVNPKERTVREARIETVTFKGEVDRRYEPEGPDEFFYDAPTAADAMAAGQRRRLAEEYFELCHKDFSDLFAIVGDRIEPQASKLFTVEQLIADAKEGLEENGFDVWREGTGLVVLGRLP